MILWAEESVHFLKHSNCFTNLAQKVWISSEILSPNTAERKCNLNSINYCFHCFLNLLRHKSKPLGKLKSLFRMIKKKHNYFRTPRLNAVKCGIQRTEEKVRHYAKIFRKINIYTWNWKEHGIPAIYSTVQIEYLDAAVNIKLNSGPWTNVS